jgi:cell wall-associated NlpC family hydrolase
MKASISTLQALKSIVLIFILVQLSGCATSEKNKLSISNALTPPHAVNKAANEALLLQGHPYVPGGESPTQGFDCSGLVFYVYNKQGIKIPRDTWSQAKQLPAVELNQRQPGDLLFFNIDAKVFGHVGIYIGQEKFVHAPSTRTGKVIMSDLRQPYWRDRFAAVRRPLLRQPLSSLDFNSSTMCPNG